MRASTAIGMLNNVKDSDKPAKVNKALTVTQARDIVKKGIVSESHGNGDYQISSLSEKRVWQIAKNQKRPRY